MDDDYETCLAMLREGDRDRYLCALLTPDSHRGPVTALYAFNLEIARVRDIVSEPMLGEIRLQWWKDLIEGGADDAAAGHPAAAGLLRAVNDYGLPRTTLLNMIEARRFDLYDDPMPDRNTFEGYAGETASALIHLCSQILEAGDGTGSTEAAGHAGVAQLVAGLLQLLPVHCLRGQLYIPADLLNAAGLDRDGFLAGRDPAAIANALSAFIALGREHLRKARHAGTQIPPESFAAYLPIAIVELLFDQSEKRGLSLIKDPVSPQQWRRQIRLWRSARARRF